MGTRQNNLPEFREIVQTQVNLHHRYHFTSTQPFHMNRKICFRHLVLLKMITFENIFKTVTQKFTIKW